jgi:hypothetical protein
MEQNYCIDKNDERDYKYDEMFFVWTQILSKCILDNVEYQNQWLEEITKQMCVFYSTAHGSNEENFLEWSAVRILWKDLWLKALELWRLDPKVWAYVVEWPRTARDLKLIKWWAKVSTIDEIKDSIINNRPVVVWSNSIKWSKGYESPYVLWGDKGSWHCVLIIWYDDDYEEGCFIIKNSYWKEKYDHGKMYLKYTDLWLLFPSKYSLIDSLDPILEYKKNIMEWIDLEKAVEWFELWLWDGKRAREPISRQEAVTVIMRAIEFLNSEK